MWKKGTIEIENKTVKYWIKHFEEASDFGIKQGRISKLEVEYKGKTIFHYDRGWDIPASTPFAEHVLESFLDNFN